MSGLGLRPRPEGLGARLRALLAGGSEAATWESVEEALIAADVGVTTTLALLARARARLEDPHRPSAGVADALRDAVVDVLTAAGSGQFALGPTPTVVLVVGVNGTGKTTTVAKLAARLRREGRSVLVAAGDTFRAAAIEQLRLLAERVEVAVVAQRPGADPGAVVFDALAAAASRGTDVVVIDTAGRLHTKAPLMAELAKVRRVVERQRPGEPRHVLLVVDATTGQNGLAQAEAFAREAGVTGVIVTKLDGTAKGGIAVAIADRLGLPIVFIGVGEEVDQLAPFDAVAYADWLFAT